MNRSTVKFASSKELITLYVTLIRSVLEYSCIVWNPLYACYVSTMEGIQRRFIKSLYYEMDVMNISEGYEMIFVYFGLPTLSKRRLCYDICFGYKIIDSFNILSIFGLLPHSHNRRNQPLLQIELFKTKYIKHKPKMRINK